MDTTSDKRRNEIGGFIDQDPTRSTEHGMRLVGLRHPGMQPTLHIVRRCSVRRRTITFDHRRDMASTCQEQRCRQSGEPTTRNQHSRHITTPAARHLSPAPYAANGEAAYDPLSRRRHTVITESIPVDAFAGDFLR